MESSIIQPFCSANKVGWRTAQFLPWLMWAALRAASSLLDQGAALATAAIRCCWLCVRHSPARRPVPSSVAIFNHCIKQCHANLIVILQISIVGIPLSHSSLYIEDSLLPELQQTGGGYGTPWHSQYWLQYFALFAQIPRERGSRL